MKQRPLPGWLPYADLACCAAAGAIWYLRPDAGPWPLVLVVAPWIARWIAAGRPTRRTPFDGLFLPFAATAGMGVWAAFDRPAAWAKFWLIVAAIAIYYAVANLPTAGHVRAFAALYALFGVGVAGYYLWTNNWAFMPGKVPAFTRLGEAIQAALPALTGHRLHPNVAGGILAMIAPYQIALLSGKGRIRRILAGLALAALVLTFLGLLLTTSRGAWVALAVGLGIWALWKVSGAPIGRPRLLPLSEGQFARFAVRFLATLLVVGLVVRALPGGWQTLVRALPGEDMLADRAALRYRAACLIRDMPFTGGGLESFRALDAAYAHPITEWVIYRVHYWVPNYHSHNLWLDIGVEQGVAGLIIFMCILGLAAAITWRALKASQGGGASSRAMAPVLEAAVVSALVILLHGLVDDALYGSRAVLLLFVPLGIVTALAPLPSPSVQRPTLRLAVPLAGIVLALAALAWQRPITVLLQTNLGAVAQARAELAGYRQKDYDLIQTRATANLGPASERFQQVLALDPEQPTANLRLGLIWLGRGEVEAAIPLLEAAHRLRPGLQAATQGLAEATLAVGRLDESAALWAGVDEAPLKLHRTAVRYYNGGDMARGAHAERVLGMLAGKE